jgi:DNA-binding MurR/RpiR family transcriptional regulator
MQTGPGRHPPRLLLIPGIHEKVSMAMINDEIFTRMGELSPAEKKVARTLLSSYPGAGLESAATLAKSAGTSTPTVLRLVSRLGIGSYPDFQRRLRDEITNHMKSPVSRTEHGKLHRDEDGLLQGAVADKVAMIESMALSVPPSEFDRAVQVLASRPRHVTISGGYFTRYLAMLLATQLDQAIDNVDFIAEPLGRDVGKFLRLGPGSVAIILDFRRYELLSTRAAELAKRQGATVIVITDQELSPAVDSADIVLPVTVDGIPFDSVVGVVALLETLVEAVLLAAGDRGIARMKLWEESVLLARAYRDSAENHSIDEREED